MDKYHYLLTGLLVICIIVIVYFYRIFSSHSKFKYYVPPGEVRRMVIKMKLAQPSGRDDATALKLMMFWEKLRSDAALQKELVFLYEYAPMQPGYGSFEISMVTGKSTLSINVSEAEYDYVFNWINSKLAEL